MERDTQGMVIFGEFKFPEEVLTYMAPNNRELALVRAERYGNRIFNEYTAIKHWFPKQVDQVLDIGCGLAGIDVMIARNHGVKVAHLIDGEGAKDQLNGYREDCFAWQDRRVAVKFLKANVVVFVQDYNPDPQLVINAEQKPILVISLLSWAHHYPVNVYMELVRKATPIGSKLIVDLRKGKGGKEELEKNGFKLLTQFDASVKCHRSLFERVS
jgi:hypothetical protein